MVTTHDERQVCCPVTAAALAVLETYSDIVTDIYGDPEERPMVLTQEHRTRFSAVVTAFFNATTLHGVPFAHDLRPYGDTAARGAAHALFKKLQCALYFLNSRPSEDPEELTRLLDGVVVVTEWEELLRDQADKGVHGLKSDPTPPPASVSERAPVREVVIGWSNILGLLRLDPKDRRVKATVDRLNKSTNGPIKRWSDRSVMADRSDLIAWWNYYCELQQATETKLQTSDRDSAIHNKNLSNPGVRKEGGFNLKKRRG